MGGEVIKSFLVGLGFSVDASSLSKFNKAIASAAVRVTALYGSIQAAATGIFWSISKISEGFEEMGYEYRIIAPAINKALVLRQELLKAYSAAGINITKVVLQSVKFNMSLAKTQFALKAIYTSVGAKFFPLLTKQMDIFRSKIYANMPKIQGALEKFVTFIFKAFEATIILGTRVWSILTRIFDFFVMLSDKTNGWSTIIFAVIAAWKLLNLSFLATPLGMMIAGLVTILALWDDFKTYMEGGKSLFDWGKTSTQVFGILAGTIAAIPIAIYAVGTAIKVVNGIMSGYTAVVTTISQLTKIWTGLVWLFNAAMAANPVALMVIGVTALIVAIGLLIWKWKEVKEWLSSFFGWISEKMKLLSLGGIIDSIKGAASSLGGNFMSNLKSSPLSAASNPLGALSAPASNNQNVNQQTQINVMGSADANSVGKAVASEQSRVNFDMVRNMTGAMR